MIVYWISMQLAPNGPSFPEVCAFLKRTLETPFSPEKRNWHRITGPKAWVCDLAWTEELGVLRHRALSQPALCRWKGRSAGCESSHVSVLASHKPDLDEDSSWSCLHKSLLMKIWPMLELNFAKDTNARVVWVLSCSVVSNSLRHHGLWPAGSFVHGILEARTRRSGFPFPTPGDRSYDSAWILPPRFVIKTEGTGWRKLASCSDPAYPLMGGHCSLLGAGGWQEPFSQGP